MAKTLYSQSGKVEYGIKKYTVDTEADKEALNLRTTKMGSKCYVIDTKKWYILNSSNQWIPFVDAGGSDGSPFNIKGSVATTDNLPSENNEIGDLYIVRENGSEWVWLTSENAPNGYWEQLGIVIDSELSQDSINPVRNSTIASAFNLYTEYLNEKVDASDASVIGGLSIVGGKNDRTGVGIHGNYNSGSPWLELHGSENDEAVQLTNLANPTANNDAATKQYVDTALNNKADKTTTTIVLSTTPIIAAADNIIYNCSELTSLTVSNFPNPGKFWIWFTSGSTATTVTGIDNFTPEANKTYKITVENGYATFDSWTVGGGS